MGRLDMEDLRLVICDFALIGYKSADLNKNKLEGICDFNVNHQLQIFIKEKKGNWIECRCRVL